MGDGVFRQGDRLQAMRARGGGIARLLLLAFILQLAAPLLDPGAIAARAGEAAFRADLQSSICHEGKSEAAPDQAPASPSQVNHCVFCLPLAGAPAIAGSAVQLPIPVAVEVIAAHRADDQVPASARPAFARSRAPPSDPRTV